jgi:hypothetical protein
MTITFCHTFARVSSFFHLRVKTGSSHLYLRYRLIEAEQRRRSFSWQIYRKINYQCKTQIISIKHKTFPIVFPFPSPLISFDIRMKQKPHSFFVISFSFLPRIYFSSAELKTHIKTRRMIFRGHKFASKFEIRSIRLRLT